MSSNPSIPTVEGDSAREVHPSVIGEDYTVISDVADDESGDSSYEESSDERSSIDTAEELADIPKETSEVVSEEISKDALEVVSEETSKHTSEDTSEDTSKHTSKHASPQPFPKKRLLSKKDRYKRVGRSSKAAPAFLSHPNGPFSIYFEPQINHCTHSSSPSSLVRRAKPWLFKPVRQSQHLQGQCKRCYLCEGDAPCRPYQEPQRSGRREEV